jgi:hypothetical protein
MTQDMLEMRLARLSYWILLFCLAVGLVSLLFNPLTALLPAAVVFGWCQIGGI